MSFQIHTSISACPQEDWNALTESNVPFFDHEFLSALEASGCVGGQSGWMPQYVCFYDDKTLVAAIPFFLKTHSYGEFIFDFHFAEAYERHGMKYYPKLTCAIPVTPVTSKRFLSRDEQFFVNNADQVGAAFNELTSTLKPSSIHILFCTEVESQRMNDMGFHKRLTSNFRWHNDSYTSFEDFLGRMTHKVRQQIQRERRAIRESGLTITTHTDEDITPELMLKVFDLYRQHHHERYGSHAYLNDKFFFEITQRLRSRLLVFTAKNANGEIIAATLNFKKGKGLFGRYWGFTEHHKFLHFELCYYRQIEYAIDNQLEVFDGGAQGEHKLKRGLTPFTVYSAHWMAHPGFHEAIGRHLETEVQLVQSQLNQYADRIPFKQSKR